VPLSQGQPGVNPGQLITAVVDNLNRRTAERPAVVQDLHMLREDWPPRTNDGFVTFGEESVSSRDVNPGGGGTGPRYFARGTHPLVAPPIIRLQQATKFQMH